MILWLELVALRQASYRAQNNLPASTGPLMCFIGRLAGLEELKHLKLSSPKYHATACSRRSLRLYEPNPQPQTPKPLLTRNRSGIYRLEGWREPCGSLTGRIIAESEKSRLPAAHKRKNTPKTPKPYAENLKPLGPKPPTLSSHPRTVP